MPQIRQLKYFANGEWISSKTEKYTDVYNPSTGEVIAHAPVCTRDEIAFAIESAKNAYKTWSNTPVMKRVQVLFKLRELIEKNIDELTTIVCTENGKSWNDAMGDVLKCKEGTEIATAAPTLMMGEALMDTSEGIDTTLVRVPVGVFAGIVPYNFPAMIPMGWMTPLCVAMGNTIVLKVSSLTPLTAIRIAELYHEAGIPKGVVNIVTGSRNEADILLNHPDIAGISFVGSTKVGLEVYSKGCASGKRVQSLCEAKNHALVLEDSPIERTAAGIINAAFGCAGQRCMALPVVIVQNSIADKLVAAIVRKAQALKIGAAYDKANDLGPVVTAKHKVEVESWIEVGVKEGATVVLDGRNTKVPGLEGGFYCGPTILDNVTEQMTVGREEIFGPVLCIKRVADFEEGMQVANASPFGNGSVIFTQNGYYAREFQKRTQAGMVGVNVGIPVPVGMFPFAGHKQSFIGDLHCLGKDGVRFYTETKCLTERWFNEEELKREKVDSWDGMI